MPATPEIPLIDPTANVLKLVEQAMQRQDDLRNVGEKYSRDLRVTKERCDKETAELREKLANAESKRIDASNLAESRRLDAVLAEQKAAVALASEKSAATAAQLATQVATTATTMAAQTNALRDSLEKRLALVEQNQYQTGGRDIQRGEAQGQFNVNRGAIIAFIGAIVGIAGLLFALLKP